MENHPDAQAKARVHEALCAYRARVAELASAGRPKPDMVAFSELRKKWLPSQQTYGHIPGVAIGDVFQGRGELAIVGLHQNMMTGILTSKDATRGALAVVLSGGYADNDDQGSSVWYTGSGGQKAGHQVQDQGWKGANQALRQAHLSGAPVRLIRQGGRHPSGGILYKYDGLYKVVEAIRQPSAEGPLVCRFRLEGVPGQHQPSNQVKHKVRSVKKSRPAAPWGGKAASCSASDEETLTAEAEDMAGQTRASASSHPPPRSPAAARSPRKGRADAGGALVAKGPAAPAKAVAGSRQQLGGKAGRGPSKAGHQPGDTAKASKEGIRQRQYVPERPAAGAEDGDSQEEEGEEEEDEEEAAGSDSSMQASRGSCEPPVSGTALERSARLTETSRSAGSPDGKSRKRAAAQHSPHKRLAGRVRHDSEFSDTGNAAAAPRVSVHGQKRARLKPLSAEATVEPHTITWDALEDTDEPASGILEPSPRSTLILKPESVGVEPEGPGPRDEVTGPASQVATSQAGAADVPGASSGAHAAACGPGCGDAMRDTDEIGATSGGEGCRVGDVGEAEKAEAKLAAECVQDSLQCPAPPGLLLADLSGGLEPWPVPVFNEVDNAPAPDDFTYVDCLVWTPDVQAQVMGVLKKEHLAMLRHTRPQDQPQALIPAEGQRLALVERAQAEGRCRLGAGRQTGGSGQGELQVVHLGLPEWCALRFNSEMNAADQQLAASAQGLPQDYEATRLDPYNEHGLLVATEPTGLHECPADCTCALQRRVAGHLHPALQLFRKPGAAGSGSGAGWGVRCTEPIQQGAFVCAVLGQLITYWQAAQALQDPAHQAQLQPLLRFTTLFNEIEMMGKELAQQQLPEHRLPPAPSRPYQLKALPHLRPPSTSASGHASGHYPAPGTAEAWLPLLVLDSQHAGNVSRFIARSADFNLVVQPVFTGQTRSPLLYLPALFATRNIDAMEELTVDSSEWWSATAQQ